MGGNDDDDSAESDSGISEPSGGSSLSDIADHVRGGDGDGAEREDRTDGSLSDLANDVRDRQRAGADAEGEADSVAEDTADEAGHSEWDVVDRSAGDAVDPKTEALLDLVSDASNILVKGPDDTAAELNLCSRLLTSRENEPINFLLISVGENAGRRLSQLRNYVATPIENTTVLDVQSYNRDQDGSGLDDSVTVRTISDSTDLRRIGILTSKIISNWEERPEKIVVCLHSLSNLTEAVEDPEIVFRFLHVFNRRIESADARAHYHINPDRHDTQELGVFSSLFDMRLEFGGDGSVSVE